MLTRSSARQSELWASEPQLVLLVATVVELARHARAPRTMAARDTHLRKFHAFCTAYGLDLSILEQRSLFLFVAFLFEFRLRPASIAQYAYTIVGRWRAAGADDPGWDRDLRVLLDGAQRHAVEVARHLITRCTVDEVKQHPRQQHHPPQRP